MYKVMITLIINGKVLGHSLLFKEFSNLSDALHAAKEGSCIYDYPVYQIREYSNQKRNVISFDDSDSGKIIYESGGGIVAI